ncbi:oxidoreductase [Nannizzia gypsea CBS 118893]|uniref:Oxidoreductase n=1 Tax=Arthroderma gypseum (strain ATCC MYA-4604 / CBS 118893) TaxID=535722 RepID=E5QYX1_ARTGP|nr:oxidoreductase [Nannizzia gypsea CBS 118893]EFQ98094.1 oxidoreductase [Nannizzia gypsea CBS 118893]
MALSSYLHNCVLPFSLTSASNPTSHGKWSDRILRQGFPSRLRLIYTHIQQKISAVGHRWTYQETPSPKNVVVLGGSYAGVHLAQRLTESLPTGYRAVLIERNSHFNHLFVFPRCGVASGLEQSAFIPYDGVAKSAPPGIFKHIHDSATSITDSQVTLASGEKIDYEYLAIATGSWQPSPAKLASTEKAGACKEMHASQERIQLADRIAVVGGGPVGVQVATDIKSFFPQKDVTLIHSRKQLLPNFGPRLHEHVMKTLKQLDVNLILGERPQTVAENVAVMAKGKTQEALSFADGRKEAFDLVIRCTGQRPNSSILANLFPSAICGQSGQILVHPTLQINNGDNMPNPNIFALGDVAKTTGPRMERTARSQAEIVAANIVSLIMGHTPLETYRVTEAHGVIKLTLGKHDWAMYYREDSGRELMVSGAAKGDNIDVAPVWQAMGAKYPPNPS